MTAPVVFDEASLYGFQEDGETARRRIEMDGTAGDAQDAPHPAVPGGPGGSCLACGLAPGADVHHRSEAALSGEASLYGLADVDCEFCLSPLHHGPCKGWRKHPEEVYENVRRSAREGKKALKVSPNTSDLGKGDQLRLAAAEYWQHAGPSIAYSLRGNGAGLTGTERMAVRKLDEMFREAATKDPVLSYRGIADPSEIFGSAWSPNGDNAGLEWIDRAYASSTADKSIATHFAAERMRGEPVVMHVLSGKGQPVLHMRSATYGGQQELLLDRGSHYRIVKDYGPGTRPRRIDVEVTPGSKEPV